MKAILRNEGDFIVILKGNEIFDFQESPLKGIITREDNMGTNMSFTLGYEKNSQFRDNIKVTPEHGPFITQNNVDILLNKYSLHRLKNSEDRRVGIRVGQRDIEIFYNPIWA